ncbi:hypothetical protein J3459_018226 [Metarhizium acridum]|uniref:Pfs, NB-ARC and Ankyrin domain protein n=1 Tax=Metarhizium acridum (strain CQMa 102) TaxID=655827 RepID=E9ECT9_METAQ|nr:Pfs, NB-ARC and Ankyrin domain protein [Metarhizium acridum CQMa 102]EFY86233.1 Pfs, NB-ARC and Ankyrin domain protein [Metarhizium acridum CQMa 102]KAG8408042.1 hypothetical protein J3459_018226 [Metarhizium acridum]
MSAVRFMLDREHPRLPPKQGDSNLYVLGELSGHNVVLACLPGIQGKGAAATVATNLARTFPSVQWRFLVGIGGHVPSDKHDIRLGDVVISMPEGQYGDMVQYDLGRDTEDNFQLKGFLLPPPAMLRGAVELMQSDHLMADNKVVAPFSSEQCPGQSTLDHLLYVDEEWITLDGKKCLWLPADYRTSKVAVYGTKVALGHWFGGLTFLEVKFT